MKVIARNKKARYNYLFSNTVIAGVSLLGSEVKSIKMGNISMDSSFVKPDKKGNMQLYGIKISKYEFQNIGVHDELRVRQLLLNKREIKKINDMIVLERLSVIPTKILLNKKGIIKIELSIGRGRKKYDKREYEREKEFNKIKQEHIN